MTDTPDAKPLSPTVDVKADFTQSLTQAAGDAAHLYPFATLAVLLVALVAAVAFLAWGISASGRARWRYDMKKHTISVVSGLNLPEDVKLDTICQLSMGRFRRRR